VSVENGAKKDNTIYVEHMLDSILRIDWAWVPLRRKTGNVQYLGWLMRKYSLNTTNRNNSHLQGAQLPLMP